MYAKNEDDALSHSGLIMLTHTDASKNNTFLTIAFSNYLQSTLNNFLYSYHKLSNNPSLTNHCLTDTHTLI